MFRELNSLYSVLASTRAVLRTFVLTVQLSYQSNPYHNFTHAFDVTHALYCLLEHVRRARFMRPLDELALMLAALCHDVGHPGVNNAFLIATDSPLALLYNDVSVLENHHSAMAFKILAQSECNVLRAADARGAARGAQGDDQRRFWRPTWRTTSSGASASARTCARASAPASPPPFDSEQRRAPRAAAAPRCSSSATSRNVFKDTALADLWMHRITDEYFAAGRRDAAPSDAGARHVRPLRAAAARGDHARLHHARRRPVLRALHRANDRARGRALPPLESREQSGNDALNKTCWRLNL
jgi:hypothetical protein